MVEHVALPIIEDERTLRTEAACACGWRLVADVPLRAKAELQRHVSAPCICPCHNTIRPGLVPCRHCSSHGPLGSQGQE